MNRIDFKHSMYAHCETGTLSSLLRFNGFDISEPMIFGIGSGIFFGYLKISALRFPTIVPRTMPGQIRKKISKRLGIRFYEKRHRSPERAMTELDELIDKGIPAAVQVDMFNMEYFPSYARAHFNAHFINIIGRDGDKYIVSDSYYPEIALLARESLLKGRFAGGDLAPRGLIFYPSKVPSNPDMISSIRAGIRSSCRNMLKIPVPFLGVKGIRHFAGKVAGWPKLARDMDDLSHQIMMISITLEDRGTGGAGFRFMYATFLQQAAGLLNNPSLESLSREMMKIGDKWREVSVFAARMGKNRTLDSGHLGELSAMLLERAHEEEAFFRKLEKAIK